MSRHKKTDSRWRDDASAEVMAGCVPHLTLGDHVLLAGDAGPVLRAAVEAPDRRASLWPRRTSGSPAAGVPRAWPVDEACSAALLRMPRAKDELDMMLHAAAARVVPGGVIAVHGANDEGIKSAAGRMEPLLGPVETVAQRAHCRVLAARRPETVSGLKPNLDDWRRSEPLEIGGSTRPWISYPGVFAKGGLDNGTRLLLAALSPGQRAADRPSLDLSSDAHVLDFACGTGVIAAHVRAVWPHARIAMADWDALAVLAAGQNVTDAQGHVAARLEALPDDRHDLIVSNPPIHDGKSEDYTVLGQLIAQAPARLSPRGALVIVVLGRVPVEEWLAAAFGQVETLAQDTRYRVWIARQPKARRAGAGGRERSRR